MSLTPDQQLNLGTAALNGADGDTARVAASKYNSHTHQSANVQAAIDGASSPSAGNVFATMSDVAGGMTYRGGYDASANTPNLSTSPTTVSTGDMYTVTASGTFYTVDLEVGDVLVAETSNPSTEAEWTVVQRDLTAASIKTAYESNSDTNALTDALLSKLNGVESSADVTDAVNVISAINGASITSATVTGVDKVLIQDADDSDAVKTVTAQSIADLASGGESSVFAVNQSSHGLSAGDIVYVSAANVYSKAIATSAASAEVAGMVSSVIDADNFNLLVAGKISGMTSLSGGVVYFLSSSASGAYSATEPSAVGEVSKPLFVAINATTAIWLNYRGMEIT